MSAPRPLNIVLVHGTWPAGIPRAVVDWLRRLLRRPARDRPTHGKDYWYQTGHDFGTTLQADLTAAGFAPRFHEPLLWTGANSFVARFAAADALADRLEALDGSTLVIAHSHGGSVAIQALQQMPKSRAGTIDVVTMGTPFVRVAASTSRALKMSVFAIGITAFAGWAMRRAVQTGVGTRDLLALENFVTRSSLLFIVLVYAIFGGATLLTNWFERRVATRLAVRFAGRHLHCIRGMSDEAGLAIAGGLVGSGLSRAFIGTVGWFWSRPSAAALLLVTLTVMLSSAFGAWSSPLLEHVTTVVLDVGGWLVIGLLLLASLGNWFLGAEMSLVGLLYMGSVDSTPDAAEGALRVDTVTTTHATPDGLRHSGFYANKSVIEAIVAGVASPGSEPD